MPGFVGAQPVSAFPLGEGVCGPARRRMRENLPDITHERAIPVNSPLISLPQAADSSPPLGKPKKKIFKNFPAFAISLAGNSF